VFVNLDPVASSDRFDHACAHHHQLMMMMMTVTADSRLIEFRSLQ
jgi:hypothetical protein